MIVSNIVAMSTNRVIGKDNQIPWYLPADLKYFKRTTMYHHVIMGRNTFESIGRPLPKRNNIVISRNPYYIATGIEVKHSIEEALHTAHKRGETEVFIMGGAAIYELSSSFWDKLYITEVHTEVEGDTFFPVIDMEVWKEISSEAHKADEKNPHDYTFKVYSR